MRQHNLLTKLNVQLHVDSHSLPEDIYVEQKFHDLIHQLITIETWKRRVYPEIKDRLVKHDTLKAYFVLYHEAVLVNILEVICYHSHILIENEGSLVDLADYCMRKFVALCGWEHKDKETDEWDMKVREMEFNICIASLSVFRYMTDCIDKLPLSTIDRILNRNDMVCALVDLVEKAPWFKVQGKNTLMFEEGSWKDVGSDGIVGIGKVEGQVWLALYNLIVEPECRKLYQYTEKRYEIVTRLKNYLNESVVDQIPILEGLWRHVEELSIVQPHLSSSLARPSIEEVIIT